MRGTAAVLHVSRVSARRRLALRRTWARTLAHEYRAGKKPRWDVGTDGNRALTRGHLQ